MGNRAKLSQNTAILLERARRFGVSDDVLLTCITSGDTAPLRIAEAQYYSYEGFVTYAEEHGELLEDAVKHGYRIKFSTPGGVQLWLQERFGLEAGKDFEGVMGTGRIDGLKLGNEQLRQLSATVADNWVFLEAGAVLDRERAGTQDDSSPEPRCLTLMIRSVYEAG